MQEIQTENNSVKNSDSVSYLLNGRLITRKKTGFSKENLQSEKYAKVRENSSEFGHCSKLGKAIRSDISEFTENCGDKLLYQKFAQLMTQIKNLDAKSLKGKRTVQNGMKNPEAENLLKKFSFGNLENLENVAVRNPGFFTIPIVLEKTEANKALFLTLKIDYKNYRVSLKRHLQKVSAKNLALEFDIFYPNENPENVLFLLALYKDEELLNFGFV